MKSLAALCAGLAVWCSMGTIAVMGTATTDRVALLPPLWLLPLLVVGIFSLIRLLHLSRTQTSLLFGSTVVLLPWLPFPIPPAALLWTGFFTVVIWIVVIAGIISARATNVRRFWLTDRRRAPLAAAAIALALYGASAKWLAPILPDGDSPHYLVLAQSLIRDGDLQIENNHRRGDYLEYSLLASQPEYLRRGVNGAIYSIHAPGLPAIIAPAMALFGYPGAVAFLGVVAALTTALIWWLSYSVTASASASWFAWASCALTTPFFFQATQVFPDGFAATCVLLGTLPLTLGSSSTALWLLSGTSLAILPWLQTRLAIVAAAAAGCLALRIRTLRQALIFAAVPLVSAAAWFSFFYVVYGTPNPTAPYGSFTQTTPSNLRNGLPGILFDEQFGLFSNAPVYGLLVVGVIAGAVKLQRWSWELLVLVVPYTIGVGMYQHWWGGTSPPARLLTPVLPLVAIAGARLWRNARSAATRGVHLAALLLSVSIAVVLLVPDRGHLLFNFRDGIALWLEWGNPILDLPRSMPSLFNDPPATAVLKAATWIAAMVGAWLTLRAVPQRMNDSPTPLLSATAVWCMAAASMVAVTLNWWIDGTRPLTPATSEIALLRRATVFRPLGFDFATGRFEASDAVLSRARIRTDARRRPTNPAPLLSASNVPAGDYQLHVSSNASPEGMLTLRVGDTPLPLWTASASPGAQHGIGSRISLPTEVRSLVVEGDAAAVRSISRVDLETDWTATRMRPAAGGSAHRAAHYPAADVFFFDENAYPEPTGFWVAGGRLARIVTTNAGPTLNLFLRNAPVENTVTIDVDGERQAIALGPGEERTIALSTRRAGASPSLLIKSQNGFRPSAADPGSRDLRYLGCWVEIRN